MVNREGSSFWCGAVEQSGAAGALQRILTASDRAVQRVPRLQVSRIPETDAIVMADCGRTVAVLRLIATGRVAAGGRVPALLIGTGQNVVCVRCVAAPAYRFALFAERRAPEPEMAAYPYLRRPTVVTTRAADYKTLLKGAAA
jgi:hypothetical protein